MGGMKKEERKIGKKILFSLVWLGEKTRGKENIVEKNHSGPTNIYPSDLGGKLRKNEPSIELHKYPQTLLSKSRESLLLLHLGTEQIINVLCFF